LRNTTFSRFPVIDGDLDRLIGVVHIKDLFLAGAPGAPIDLRAVARLPLYRPEATPALQALARFQASGQQMALIVDEHGSVEGLLTLTDILEGVVGDLRGPEDDSRARAIQREDGSWLVDGRLTIKEFLERLGLREIPGDEEGFTTIGGLVLAHLHRIPVPGDHFEAGGWRFEVLDMDLNRIDKVLVSKSQR
ncbi:MAG: HlyC/CorC family transporter, partial [Bryobacterales bacterium]|nr:HlyC/CorC family transporter [Bryobacterales bacterium]